MSRFAILATSEDLRESHLLGCLGGDHDRLPRSRGAGGVLESAPFDRDGRAAAPRMGKDAFGSSGRAGPELPTGLGAKGGQGPEFTSTSGLTTFKLLLSGYVSTGAHIQARSISTKKAPSPSWPIRRARSFAWSAPQDPSLRPDQVTALTNSSSCASHHRRRRSKRSLPPISFHIFRKLGSPASTRRRTNSPPRAIETPRILRRL